MKRPLQKPLYASYSNFCRRPKKENDAGPFDCWDIECGDGWFLIIDNLSAPLETGISD